MADELTIRDRFTPVPDFNECDHCVHMPAVEDYEMPCRWCPHNANAAAYLREDLAARNEAAK